MEHRVSLIEYMRKVRKASPHTLVIRCGSTRDWVVVRINYDGFGVYLRGSDGYTYSISPKHSLAKSNVLSVNVSVEGRRIVSRREILIITDY